MPAALVVAFAVVPGLHGASALGTTTASCSTASSVSVTPATSFQAMFDSYGNDNTRTDDWTGADGAYSIPLPGGDVAWSFSDTFLGQVGADGSRPGDAPLINNDLVVQRANRLVATIHGGTTSAPSSLVTTSDASWYWMGDGTVEGQALRVFLPKYTRTGPGPWDWEWSGTDIGSFPLSGGAPTITPAPSSGQVTWGAAILELPGWTYVYGVEDLGLDKYLHVARAPQGGLLGPWQFWTGTGWSTDPGSSARLLDHVDDGFGVMRVGSTYVLVTLDTAVPFSGQIVLYTSCSSVGPWGGETNVYATPENQWPTFTYGVHAHPEFGTTGGVLISYDVNSSWSAVHQDVELYRPRFLRLRLAWRSAEWAP